MENLITKLIKAYKEGGGYKIYLTFSILQVSVSEMALTNGI